MGLGGKPERVAVVGAGIGGLACAIQLATAGVEVVVLEQAPVCGGKMHATTVGGRSIDSGPTVLTLRYVFDALFDAAGASLDEAIALAPAEVLGRYAWGERQWLDLHADAARSAEAIGDFAGADAAAGFLAFCAESRRVWETLRETYLEAQQTNVAGLTWRVGPTRPLALMGIRPFETLWRALGRHFPDPRLRQMFARYSTYCGASPFKAPATLMLIAHAEREGVWLVEGGMQRLAQAMEALALRLGVTLRADTPVERIVVERGRAAAVVVAGGERIDVSAVVVNADPGALPAGLFGEAVRGAARASPAAERSLSAFTLALTGVADGPALERHTVLFSADYPREFAELAAGAAPRDPTVYICAQDRPGALAGPERLFMLINAPANGDAGEWPKEAKDACERAIERRLAACGLTVTPREGPVIATPADFATRFPATGGALYGPAMHGWAAAFRRPGARTRIPGLYLAGGGAHPGAGAPMAALSGRLAAQALMADRVSTPRFRPAATPGGMSMRSAPTESAASP
jgi:1-hydroxycarotenoid 3,4-desaturase